MRITETTNNDNNVSRISKLLDTGNIIPTIWYHKLLRESGKSDCTAIAILSELVLLHCDEGSKELHLNFKYFKDKFNFGLSQVKDAVIRLEKLGLVTRSPRTINLLGRTFANEMFLVLNIDKVLELTDETNLSDDLRSKKFQQSVINNNHYPKDNPIEISSSEDNHKNKKSAIEKNQCVRNKFDTPSVEIAADSIDKEEKTQATLGNSHLPSAEISADAEDKMAKSGGFLKNFCTPSAEISSVPYIDISNNNLKSRYIDRLRDRYSKSGFLKISDEENQNRDEENEKTDDSLVSNSLQSKETRDSSRSSLDKALVEPAEPAAQSNFKTFKKKSSNHPQEENADKEVEVEAESKDRAETKAKSDTRLEPDSKTEKEAEAESKPKNEDQDSTDDKAVSAETSENEKKPSLITKIRSKFSFFGKKLSEFHPLSDEDRDLLVVKSGRDFDLNFINQLMLRISDKYPDHKFYNKNCVLNYMTKLLAHELRDAVKVSNGCFRFKNNQEDRRITDQERYLQEIESSPVTCKVMQLKRKIAGIFESSTAYSLLVNTEFSLQGDEFTMEINNKSAIPLSSHQQDILLAQVRSVYGNNVLGLNIQAPGQAQTSKLPQTLQQMRLQAEIQQQAVFPTELELCHKSANQFVSAIGTNGNEINSYYASHSGNYRNNYADNDVPTPAAGIASKVTASKEHDSIWSRVRNSLVEHFRDGEWLDKTWFSKLEAIYDHDSQKLTLKAPTKLIRDRVWQQYGYLIEKFCTDVNYQLVGVQS